MLFLIYLIYSTILFEAPVPDELLLLICWWLDISRFFDVSFCVDVQRCFTVLLCCIVHAWDMLFVWSFRFLASLFAYSLFILSCLEQIFISCVVSFHEADCCHGDNSPQMEARERGVQQRVFTGSDTKLVDTHTWYSRYDENLRAYRRSRAQTHMRTWLQTDLQSLSKLGQFFYVINFTPRWKKKEMTCLCDSAPWYFTADVFYYSGNIYVLCLT